MLTTEKIAVVDPMPRASVMKAIAANEIRLMVAQPAFRVVQHAFTKGITAFIKEYQIARGRPIRWIE